ncbi:MAG: TonB-dependent receptor [Verrucomicrobia bacterium]|nr:TonB-dependent receptor [Verrucomicrobiota bacterium]
MNARVAFKSLFVAAAWLLLPARAADHSGPATGAITGRVLNLSTREFLSNAEVRVEGTALVATTERDGTYRLTPVPAGAAVVTVTYTGATTARSTVQVAPGRTATLDFEVTNRADGPGATDVLKLGAFVVSSEREGNAKAIMEQRNSMNLTNSVSSDYFGDVAEGNVGEFLKNMPGVDLEYVGPDSRGPRLRGLDPAYVGVSVDGFKMASGDASQGSDTGARSFSFDQVSVNSIDRIEVNYTSSADMDANAPAGTINLKTKRAFERKGRRLSWQVNFMANSDNFSLRPSYGPGDKKTRKFRPGGILEYSDVFLQDRLGVVLNLSESNQYALQWRMNYTYNATPTAADPRPRVITAVAFLQQPKLSERFTPTLTIDFKATPSLVLSLMAMYNWYDTFFDGRTATFTATNRAAVTGDGLTAFNYTNSSLGLSQNHSHKIVRTRTISPKLEYRRGEWVVDAAFNYSISTNQYEAMLRGGPVNTPVAALTGLGLALRRSSTRDNDWTLTQTGGRDFADLAGFTNPRANDEGRYSEDEIFQGQLNAKFTTGWRAPTWFKLGAKATEEYHRFRNPNAVYTYQFNGPGGGATGSFAGIAFPDYRWELGHGVNVSSNSGRPPTFPNRVALGEMFLTRPENFTDLSTAANFYTAYIANPTYIKERFVATYLLGNTKLGRLNLQGGLRWEDSRFATREFQARSTAQVRAAGYTMAAANGRATTVPGLVYQFMSLPKVSRGSGYDNLFPSVSAKYNVTPNLQAHLGYSSTISRPAFNNLGGVWVFNETAQTVDVPNPNLRPERAKNLTGRLAYYFEPVGSLAVTAFQNEITDSVVGDEFPASAFGYEDDPTYANYRFLSVANRNGVMRIRGYTVEYSQALSFLPGALKGLNASASYTRTYASSIRPGMVPHMIGGTLSYRHRRVSLGVSGKWTDDTPMSSTGNITYRKLRTMIDVNGTFQITPRASVFFQARNIFNVPEYRYQIDPSFITQYVTFGTVLTCGVKGTF